MTANLEFEARLGGLVAGVDEVGRGALAGPVFVGIVVVGAQTGAVPGGLTDSKLLSERKRKNLVPLIKDWALDWALGQASAAEIDEIGIVAALRLAWQRGFAQLSVRPEQVILDGKHNWITPPAASLFAASLEPGLDDERIAAASAMPVNTQIKADVSCASVAGASVLAKVHRDALMAELAELHPEYGWASNVGYGAAGHMQAIREFGPTQYHRKSWKLPT